MQAHGLPLKNMNLRNIVAIGKGLINLLKVDNAESLGSIYQSYLRILVEVEVKNPLKSSFPLKREKGPPLWIKLKYERLGDYCISCGILGHKKASCSIVEDPLFSA